MTPINIETWNNYTLFGTHLGGHDNVCFDAMLPLDVVPLRRQSLSDSTPVSSPPL